MIYEEDIVLECLEKKSFSGIVIQRSLQGCHWYDAKFEGELYQIEVYSPEFLDDGDLKKYLESIKFIPEKLTFLRRPTHVYEDRGYTFVVRKSEGCYPLIDLFLRPGSVDEKLAINIVKKFEVIQDYLLANPLENFSPLAVLFQIDDEGQVYLDSFRCGPWIKNFSEINIIYQYLKPELNWQGQFFYFKNKMALKLFLGSPKTLEINREFDADWLSNYLNEIFVNGSSFQANISSYMIKKTSSKRNLYFLSMTLLLLISLSFLYRKSVSFVEWQGLEDSGVQSSTQMSNVDIREELVPNTPLREENDDFQQTKYQLERLLLLGNFKDAILLMSSYKNESQKAYFTDIRTSLSYLITKDYSACKILVSKLISDKAFDIAQTILQNRISGYPTCEERDSLIGLLKEVEQEKEENSVADKITPKVNLILNDRQLIESLVKILEAPFNEPLIDLPIKIRQLNLVREELKTSAGVYLVSCWVEFLEAGNRLYSALINASAESAEEILLKLKEVERYKSMSFLEISEKGFEYRDVAGGGCLEFNKIDEDLLLELFSSLVSNDRNRYDLFLYAMLRKKYKYAQSLLKEMTSVEILDETTRFKDLEQAKSDLWSPLGK